jgi:peptidoglycan/LPS O-acetylase OafA/YrhL
VRPLLDESEPAAPPPTRTDTRGAEQWGPPRRGPWFVAPALALLAALAILEGYRWIGVIANEGARPWAVAFAAGALAVSFVLARSAQPRDRGPSLRIVLAASVLVASSTVVVLFTGERWATGAVGVSDLAMATAALVVLLAGERVKRRGHAAA